MAKEKQTQDDTPPETGADGGAPPSSPPPQDNQSAEQKASSDADAVQAAENARVAAIKREREERKKQKLEEESAPPPSSGRVRVRKGQFIQMQGATWFRCPNVNVELNRDLSAVAVALEDFEYDASVGGPNNVVKNFTLRRYFKDPNRPQKCYTLYRSDRVDGNQYALGLEEYFEDLIKRGKADAVARIRPTIMAAVKEFERQYREPQAA